MEDLDGRGDSDPGRRSEGSEAPRDLHGGRQSNHWVESCAEIMGEENNKKTGKA